MKRLLPVALGAGALIALACQPVPPSIPPELVTTTSTTTSTTSSTTSPTASTTSSTSSTTSTTVGSGSSDGVDLTRLPLGDGKLGTSPEVGYVDSCQTTFGGGGAFANGPWINTSTGTWDRTSKATVDGEVTWLHSFTITTNDATRTLTGNGLPNHATGVFPISSHDDAYLYDRNPNSILSQNLTYTIPTSPTVAARATCVGLGPIGVLLSGVPLFNAVDAAGHDAAAHEVQDGCGGHPERTGSYHYHDLSNCIDDGGEGHSPLVGYALDGFGIYGHRGEDGEMLTDAHLDECHGHTHAIEWEGQTVVMYHYHATYEYPYTVGCFRGTPAT